MAIKSLARTYETLPEKQRLFVEFYLQTLNATESARRAGYKAKNDKSMKSIGYRLKMDLMPIIEKRLREGGSNSEEVNKKIADTNEILSILTKIARGEEKDAFGLDTSNQDKLKALELLGKANQLYVDRVKQETNLDINVNLVDEDLIEGEVVEDDKLGSGEVELLEAGEESDGD